jgi:plastocyanin
MLRAIPAAVFAAAAVVVSSSITDAVAASTSFKHPLVTVHAKEYAFVAPASIAAGTTTFRLVNDGKEPHQISIVQLAKGKTLADFVAAAKAMQPTPWAVGVGGPNTAGPGQTIDATVSLDAGNYLLLCWVPSPGAPVPHLMKGMIQPLTVTAPGGVTQAGTATSYLPEPVPDVHLELSEYGFKFSKRLTAGKHTIHVMNTGAQEHEAVFMKLAPGKKMKDVDAWFESGMKGPSPIEAMPGMAGLGKGRTASFTTTLTPGTYGLACYIPDAKDGKPHAMHGMVQEITVAAK